MKDSYIWQARVLPATAFMLPFYIEINYLLRLSDINITWSTVVANLVISLTIVVFSNYCRYKGKKAETKLFNKWGGPPTTRFLRCSNSEYNVNNKKLVKLYWTRIKFDTPIPSEEEEKDNPQQADLAYSAFVSKLRVDSRSSKLFPLLQSENRNYGMWRNLYGIKWISLLLCVALIICNICLTFFLPHFMTFKSCCVVSGILVLIAFLWLFIVGESKVKQAAEAYAERLFETCYTNTDHIKGIMGDEK